MKKASLCLFGLVLLMLFQSVSVMAADSETPLDEQIDDLLGTRYRTAGTTEKGFDCSGFTMYVYEQFGIDLPHNSKRQSNLGSKIAKDDLRAGDLVFFDTGGAGISHVGIYIGNGQFVHSASNKGVVVNKLSEAYYVKRYVTARRILDDNAYLQFAAQPASN